MLTIFVSQLDGAQMAIFLRLLHAALRGNSDLNLSHSSRLQLLIENPVVLLVLHRAILFHPAILSTELNLSALARDTNAQSIAKLLVLGLLDAKSTISKMHLDLTQACR